VFMIKDSCIVKIRGKQNKIEESSWLCNVRCVQKWLPRPSWKSHSGGSNTYNMQILLFPKAVLLDLDHVNRRNPPDMFNNSPMFTIRAALYFAHQTDQELVYNVVFVMIYIHIIEPRMWFLLLRHNARQPNIAFRRTSI
jgi:hypothetical protein